MLEPRPAAYELPALQRNQKKVVSLLWLVLLVFVCSPASKALSADLSASYTWKEVKIGGGGFVTGIVAHPTTSNLVYARTDVGGAYRWDSANSKWIRITLASSIPSPVAADNNVESIAISKTNDQVVYIAVGNNINSADGRILKSTNRGASWTDVTTQRWKMGGNLDYRQGSERLVVDPSNDNVLYFGSRKEGLWVSNNGGGNWSQVSTSSIPLGANPGGSGDAVGVKFVYFDPASGTTNGKTNRIYVSVAGEGLYKSDNAGSSWTKILTETSSFLFDADLAGDGTFYVAGERGGVSSPVKKYNPTANTWTTLTMPVTSSGWNVAVDPFNSSRVFVFDGGMRDGRIFRSTNAGANWSTLNLAMSSPGIPWVSNTNEDQWMSTGNVIFDPHTSGKLWFAQGVGVWTSTDINDSELTWSNISQGIEEMVASDIVAPSTGKVVVSVADRQGFYFSNVDAYPSKTLFNNDFSSASSLDYSGQNPSFLAAVEYDHRDGSNKDIWYSTDSGANWIKTSASPGAHGGEIAVSATNTMNMVVVKDGYNLNPMVTTDRGATWTELTWFGSNKSFHEQYWWFGKKALTADRVQGGVFYLYVGNNAGEFYRSTNNGQTWEKAPGTAPLSWGDTHVHGQIEAVPGQAGHVWVGVYDNGLSYTTNKGDSWTKITAIQSVKAFGFGQAMNGSSYPAVYAYAKINNEWALWRSTDQGANWDKIAKYPGNIQDTIYHVTGDMSAAGKVYVGFSGNSFVYGTTGGGSTVTLQAAADRDSDNGTSGTAANVNASQWTTGYYKFSLSSAPSSITSAKLRIYRGNTAQGSLTVSAYQVANDSWTESTAGNAMPAAGSLLQTVNSSAVGYVEIDVTSFIQNEKAGDGTATLAIKTSASGWTGFYSKDNASNKPELIIQ
jgi:hypothetical protein